MDALKVTFHSPTLKPVKQPIRPLACQRGHRLSELPPHHARGVLQSLAEALETNLNRRLELQSHVANIENADIALAVADPECAA